MTDDAGEGNHLGRLGLCLTQHIVQTVDAVGRHIVGHKKILSEKMYRNCVFGMLADDACRRVAQRHEVVLLALLSELGVEFVLLVALHLHFPQLLGIAVDAYVITAVRPDDKVGIVGIDDGERSIVGEVAQILELAIAKVQRVDMVHAAIGAQYKEVCLVYSLVLAFDAEFTLRRTTGKHDKGKHDGEGSTNKRELTTTEITMT